MISVYLSIVEQELDQLLVERKKINDHLRIVQENYKAIEHYDDEHSALKIAVLYHIVKYQFELNAVDSKIEAANNAIKELHQIRINTKKERHERNESDIQ